MDFFSSRLLLYRPYKKYEILLEKYIAGISFFDVLISGFYRITLIGAGGGGAGTKSSNSSASSAGASGSGFVGIVFLTKGTYQSIVGAGGIARYGLDMNAYGDAGQASYLKQNENTIVCSPGGGGGHSWWRSGAEYAALGAMPIVNTRIKSVDINRQGNTGAIMADPGYGGSSVLGGTNYGKGGDANRRASNTIAYNGNDGYFKVEFISVS